jgi:putative methionine-R-sulfoxide reductase with GAF domain
MIKNGLGRVYADGEVIYKEGENSDMMYVIQSGEVKITKVTPKEDFQVISLKKGDIFGEMALFDKLPRSSTATASGTAKVLGMDRKKLFSTMRNDNTLMVKVLESMTQRIQRLNEKFQKLKNQKSDMIRHCIDIDETCSLILEEAHEIIPADNGSVMLLDDDNKSLFIKAAFGTESDSKIKLGFGEGIAGDVVRTGKAALVNNASMDSRFITGSREIKSMLCIPLRCRGRHFGVINMSNSTDKVFTDADLKLLHSVAMHASIAIENSKNFTVLRDTTDEVLSNATLLDM